MLAFPVDNATVQKTNYPKYILFYTCSQEIQQCGYCICCQR